MGWLQSNLPLMAMLMNQFIYAGISLSSRLAFLHGMKPSVYVVYRHVFATIVIAPIAYFSGRNSGSYHLNLKSFSWIFFISLIGITVNQNLFFEGIYLSSSSTASAMANLVPAFTFVIAACTGLESVNIRSMRSIAKILGTVVCVSGALSIALLKGQTLLNVGIGGDNWLMGCLSLFGSCTAWSLWLILQVPASNSHPDHLSFSAWMCFMATFQSAAVTLVVEPDVNAWKIHSLLEFGCSLYAGVMGSAVLFFLQAWCISKRGPLFSAMFNPLFTVIATVLAAILLHEKIYVGSLLGAIGVIIGLYVVLWGKAEEVAVKEEEDPKSQVNSSTEDVNVLIDNESHEKTCKNDLEQPLLSSESPSHR
ncbi:WAT1-related protein At4g30420 [Cajanus cajan]|uniref:WAT1-related protein n=1 Tax=Cajanus cajan TaxID=3821 RepID=A0A151QZY4_CAJCA|nr:WAT1-related protein At4g30420 [Cajanus cajan]KYP35819.1 Auxin-induced protein 5NG4 [Cajanus cajan]